MGKVAFLSLNYSGFRKENLMKQFFCKEHTDKYNLYIHAKTPPKNKYFSKHVIPESYHVPTEWGYYSLILATVRLMKYALLNKENEKFILISDSHAPLYSIDVVCEKIFKDFGVMSFDPAFSLLSVDKYEACLNPFKIKLCPFKEKSALGVTQWFTLDRKDAEFFVSNEPRLRTWFNQETSNNPDEIYFSLLANHYNLPFQIRRHCFVQWWDSTKHSLVLRGHRKYPKTFDEVPNDLIDFMRSEQCIFFRKVYKQTKLDINYILKNESCNIGVQNDSIA